MKASHTVRAVFDDPNLVSAAGLVPALRLAESAGLSDLLKGLTVASPNAVIKAVGMVAGMLAGADSIDDLDLLRHGAMPRLFDGIRAPSTLGTYLRSFTHGHVQQLDRVNAGLLTGLAARLPAMVKGIREGLVFIDLDDTVREVHGYGKQAAAFGYTGIRGLNIALATISTSDMAPVIAQARLRRGNTASNVGCGRMLAQAIGTAKAAGATGQIVARADSAFYCHSFVATAVRHQAWYSVTAPMNPQVKTAIGSIDDSAWEPIEYPHAMWEEAEQRWVSDAEVAEVPITVFIRRRKQEQVACRLVVRRVKRLQPLASDGTAQGELFAAYRHHAFITNSTLPAVEADARHRDHAIVEQVIAELKDGPLAHLPSGRYAANAAWVAHAVIAFNIARAIAAAGPGRHRWATLRTRLINVPARIATTGRRLYMHLPRAWPWVAHWQALWATATGPPSPATT